MRKAQASEPNDGSATERPAIDAYDARQNTTAERAHTAEAQRATDDARAADAWSLGATMAMTTKPPAVNATARSRTIPERVTSAAAVMAKAYPRVSERRPTLGIPPRRPSLRWVSSATGPSHARHDQGRL